MYTRSYNIQSRKDNPCTEQQEALKLQNQCEGEEVNTYNGTAVLREQESTDSNAYEDFFENSEEKSQAIKHKPRRFNFCRAPSFFEKECECCSNTECIEETGCDIHEEQCKELRPCMSRKKADLDRLFIGAVMLLLLNEKSDDVLLLVLGYILM